MWKVITYACFVDLNVYCWTPVFSIHSEFILGSDLLSHSLRTAHRCFMCLMVLFCISFTISHHIEAWYALAMDRLFWLMISHGDVGVLLLFSTNEAGCGQTIHTQNKPVWFSANNNTHCQFSDVCERKCCFCCAPVLYSFKELLSTIDRTRCLTHWAHPMMLIFLTVILGCWAQTMWVNPTHLSFV